MTYVAAAPVLHRVRLGLFALGSVASCTCPSTAYQRAYDGAIEAESDAYRHAGGIATVRKDAVGVLTAEHFAIDESASSTTRVQSSWREDGESRTRMILELDEDAAGTRVRATRSTETLSEPAYEKSTRERATAFEAAVVRSLAPTEASKGDEALADHAFELPARILFEEAARLLNQRGEFVEARAETDPLYTLWHETSDRAARTRYEVVVVDIDATHRRLEAHVERERVIAGSRAWQPGPSQRDLPFELSLVDRRDPTGASAIRSRADAQGRAAHDEAIEHGPSCDL